MLVIEGTPSETGGPALASLLGADEIGQALRSATAVHLDHLLEWSDAQPGKDLIPFEQFLGTSLGFASRNFQDGDPLFENRAALIAIGIAVGDSDLSQLVGIDLEKNALASIHRLRKRVRLRQRQDWSRHFAISAAITAAFSNDSVMDFLGEFKEEIDADDTESGFSFSDLMANQAGARFAQYVMSNERNARATHKRAKAGLAVADFFPDANGLPDGISREDLLKKYGGTNGKEYNNVLDEIRRRLATAPLLSGSR